MRILLLGRDGQIGWELLRALAPLGEVIAPIRTEADLRDIAGIEALIARSGADVIVNAAAYTAVDAAEQHQDDAWRVNADAPGAMAASAARTGALFVHYSTDYVFDGTSRRGWRETDPTAPLNVYGRSKLAGEDAIRMSGARHLVFRTSWVYSNRRTNFLGTMLRLAADQPQLRVVDDQTGAPTWALHIAAATAIVLARWSGQSGIYHLTAAGQTTWYGFAREILVRAGGPDKVVPVTTAEFPRPALRPAWSVLDNTRLFTTFDVALPDWRIGLAQCMDARSGVG